MQVRVAGPLKLGTGAAAEREQEPQLVNRERSRRQERNRAHTRHPRTAAYAASVLCPVAVAHWLATPRQGRQSGVNHVTPAQPVSA